MVSFGWEICSSGGLLTVAVSGVFVVLAFLNYKLQILLPASLTHLFRTKGYGDAQTSEKLQLTESAIIKQVCTRI